MNSKSHIITDGAIAGLLGGCTVALWFLIFDISRGAPFFTPRLLGALIFYGSTAPVISSTILVVEYSIFHFAAFVSFGVIASLLIEAAERDPTLVLALAIFLFAFEALFVALSLFLGPAFVTQLSWWSVLAGNLMATAVMLGYFFSRHPQMGRQLLGRWAEPAVEGTLAGILGATAVALWFLLVDINRGEPLRTPALLGGMILESVRNPAGIRATVPLILGYTVFHYTAFVLFGIFAASLIAAGEHDPLLLFGFFVLFVCFEVLFLGFVAIISHVLLEELGLGAIVTGNLLASIVMLVVFYRRHPQLLARLVRGWAESI